MRKGPTDVKKQAWSIKIVPENLYFIKKKFLKGKGRKEGGRSRLEGREREEGRHTQREVGWRKHPHAARGH